MLGLCIVVFLCVLMAWSVGSLFTSEGYIRAQEMKKKIKAIFKKSK